MTVTEEDIDILWTKLNLAVKRLAAAKSAIKRQGCEADLLGLYGQARDVLEQAIKGDRQRLIVLFGGDCIRIAHLSTILDSQEFTTMGAKNDQRTGMCRKMCTNIMGVLEDLGLQDHLLKAKEAEASKWNGPDSEHPDAEAKPVENAGSKDLAPTSTATVSTTSKETSEALAELPPQTQSKEAIFEDLPPQTQNKEEALTELPPQTQSKEAIFEELPPQTQSKEAIFEDLPPQTQNKEEALAELPSQTQNKEAIFEELPQQTQSKEEALAELPQQTQSKEAIFEELPQQTQNTEETFAELPQQITQAEPESEGKTCASTAQVETALDDAIIIRGSTEFITEVQELDGPLSNYDESEAIDKEIRTQATKGSPFDSLEHLGKMRKAHEPCSIQVVSHSLDDDQTARICASISVEQLRSIDCPHRTEYPGPWMVYQVHRAYLNDPKLTSLDFTNMHMPTGKNEGAIAPKLMRGLAANTHLTQLILDNSNCQPGEILFLADSLTKNTTMSVLNLDNNAISVEALMRIALSLTNYTSGLKVLHLYNQLSEPRDNRRLQELLLHAVRSTGLIFRIFFEFTDPIKSQLKEACQENYAKNSCCIGCAFSIPEPSAEAQCESCKRFVCRTFRRCPLDSKLKTLEGAFEKGLPFELVGFPQHCWRNPVELDNLRSAMEKDNFSAFQAMEKTQAARNNVGKMCKYCIAEHTGEAMFEYYAATNGVQNRPSCAEGKHCRVQTYNMKHATNYNHVVP